MEKEMGELYIEGVAIHGGPESCVGVREGAGEALTGVRAGWAIEPRNQRFGVPTPSHKAEGNIAGGVMRESSAGPARSKNLCTCGISMRENRETPWSPVPNGAGREGKAEAVIP
jgi:RNA-directed DNA polymerase